MSKTLIANEAADGQSELTDGLERPVFETWAKDQAYFGYAEADPLLVDRDGDGYSDSCVHAAWMGYRLAFATKRSNVKLRGAALLRRPARTPGWAS